MKILKTANYKKAFDSFMEDSPYSGADVWSRYRERAVDSVLQGKNVHEAVREFLPTHEMSSESIEQEVRIVLSLVRDKRQAEDSEDQGHIDAERANEQYFENRGVDPYHDKPVEY